MSTLYVPFKKLHFVKKEQTEVTYSDKMIDKITVYSYTQIFGKYLLHPPLPPPFLNYSDYTVIMGIQMVFLENGLSVKMQIQAHALAQELAVVNTKFH